jgi:hypothetical protein
VGSQVQQNGFRIRRKSKSQKPHSRGENYALATGETAEKCKRLATAMPALGASLPAGEKIRFELKSCSCGCAPAGSRIEADNNSMFSAKDASTREKRH